ncbi:MAG: hypothetical protein OXG57_10185 [Acidimicrobiaceae bacterium]|nr:hypothetical protein [Acidimicrobiaceae bacterium]
MVLARNSRARRALRRWRRWVVVLAALAVAAGPLGASAVSAQSQSPAIVVSPSPVVVEVGESARVNFRITHDPPRVVSVLTITSSDPDVAGVKLTESRKAGESVAWGFVAGVVLEDFAIVEGRKVGTTTLELQLSGYFGYKPPPVQVTVVEAGAKQQTQQDPEISNNEPQPQQQQAEAPTLVLSRKAVWVAKDGTTSYTVKLSADPGQTATVEVTNPDSNTFGVSPTSLSFTAGSGGTWSTAQTVTVTAKKDRQGPKRTADLLHTIRIGSDTRTGDTVTINHWNIAVFDAEFDASGLTGPPGSVLKGHRFTPSIRINEGDVVGMRWKSTGALPFPATVFYAFSRWTSSRWDPSNPPVSLTPVDWTLAPGDKAYKALSLKAEPDFDHQDERFNVTLKAREMPRSEFYSYLNVRIADDRKAHIEVEPVAETTEIDPGESVTMRFRFTAKPRSNVVVSVADGGASWLTLSQTTPLTIAPKDYNKWHSFTVTASADRQPDDTKGTVRLSVRGAGASFSSERTFVPGTDGILSPSSLALEEGGAAKKYTLALAADPGQGQTARVTLTATAAGKVSISPASLTFSGGSNGDWGNAQEVTVTPLVDDNRKDDTLFVTHTVSGVTPALAISKLKITVKDKPGLAAVSITDATATEGDPMSFIVHLSSPRKVGTTLSYRTAHSSAGAGDYTGTQSGSVTIAANQSTATITVATTQDSLLEGDETFTVTLSGPPSQVRLRDATAVGTIQDNEVPVAGIDSGGFALSTTSLSITEEGARATFSVRLKQDPSGNTHITLSGSASNLKITPQRLIFGASGTANGWAKSQLVTVRLGEDFNTTDDQYTITLSGGGLANGTVTINETDQGEAVWIHLTETVISEHRHRSFINGRQTPFSKFAEIHLRLTSDPGQGKTVVVESSKPPNHEFQPLDGSSNTTDETVRAEFTGGSNGNWDKVQKYRIWGVSARDVDDVDEEVVLTWTVSGYGGVTTAPDTAFTVKDDYFPRMDVLQQTHGSTIHHNPTSGLELSLDEGGGTSYYCFLPLYQPDVPARVDGRAPFKSFDEDGVPIVVTLAVSPSDQTAISLSRTRVPFSPIDWKNRIDRYLNGLVECVTITPLRDTDTDDDVVTITHTVSGYFGVTSAPSVTITVKDADRVPEAKPSMVVFESSLRILEGQVSGLLHVRLREAPPGTVTVTPSAVGSSALTFSPAKLTFNSSNFDKYQQIRVSATPDADKSDNTAKVRLTATPGSFDVIDIPITIVDQGPG